MKGLLIQEVKTLFKSPASLSILIIPIVLMLGLGFILPSGWIIPSSITIGIVGSVLLYFGGSIEEIKRTSFMKSLSLTKMNKFTFLATKILFSIVVSLFSVLWVLFFGYFFSEVIPLLVTTFASLIPESDDAMMNFVRNVSFAVDWSKINWIVMLYAGSITIIVSTSLAFVFVAFSKSSLSFYLMSFGYLLAMILFGGIIMPSALISPDNSWFKMFYYLVPNFYTNNVMATSFGNGLDTLLQNVLIPLDKVIDIDYIRLGYIFEMLEKINSDTLGVIAQFFILNATLDFTPEELKVLSEMTPDQMDQMMAVLSEFFTSGNGTMLHPDEFGSLTNIDINIDNLNIFEKHLYDILAAPIIKLQETNSKANSLEDVFRNILNGYVPSAVTFIVLPFLITILEKFIMTGQIVLPQGLIDLIVNLLPDEMLEKLSMYNMVYVLINEILASLIPNGFLSGGSVIADNVSSIWALMVTFTNLPAINVVINSDWFSGMLANIVNDAVGPMGDVVGPMAEGLTATEFIQAALDKLISDFSPSSVTDYVIPWIETIVFMTISTIFFKWS